jgi:hypothetical protein
MSELSDDIEAPRCRDCEDYHYGPCQSGAPMTNQRNALIEIRERAYRLAIVTCPDTCGEWEHPLCWIARRADAALRALPDEPAADPQSPFNWDACDEHETVFPKGAECPKCLVSLLREVLTEDDANVDTATTLSCDLIDRIRAVVNGQAEPPAPLPEQFFTAANGRLYRVWGDVSDCSSEAEDEPRMVIYSYADDTEPRFARESSNFRMFFKPVGSENRPAEPK